MNGYYRNKSSKAAAQVRPLELNDIEFVSEDEDASPFINERKYSHGYFHRCPRCHASNRVRGAHPYCSECNWDSLTSPDWAGRCAT